jgi:hypothetical protein
MPLEIRSYGDPDMANGQHAKAIWLLGTVAACLVGWELLRHAAPAPGANGAVTHSIYRLIDKDSGVTVGEWMIAGGRSTLILRDGNGIPRLVLEADPDRGGMIRVQDCKGHWNLYPDPPPNDN